MLAPAKLSRNPGVPNSGAGAAAYAHSAWPAGARKSPCALRLDALRFGSSRVDALAHIGAGAVIRQGIHIGEAAIVGAGAVVVKDVPAGVTVVGVPAKILE